MNSLKSPGECGMTAYVDCVVSVLVAEDPEVARFLASGMLRYLDCRLGGECYCGKALDQREIVGSSGSLIPALTLCLKHWLASQENGRAKATAQSRAQWPKGLLVSDEIAAESGVSDDAVALLAQLFFQARREGGDKRLEVVQ